MKLEYIIRDVLKEVLSEQETASADNVTEVNVFSDNQKKFLGTFALAGSKHLGIIYSISDIGIREFVARSGTQFNCSPAIILEMVRAGYIKIVPYTGYGRDTDYTMELQLPIESIQQFAAFAGAKDTDASGDADGDTSSPSSGGGGSFGGGGGLPPIDDLAGDIPAGEPPIDGEEPPIEGEDPPIEGEDEPDLEVAHIVKYGDLLKESVKISKQLMLEASKSKKKSSTVKDVKIHLDKSRILRRVPKEFIYQLKRVIHTMQGKTFNKFEQERLIADIIDNLQLNFKLSTKQIHRAYEFHRNQKRLQKFLDTE